MARDCSPKTSGLCPSPPFVFFPLSRHMPGNSVLRQIGSPMSPGATSLEDKPRRGRTSDFDDQALLTAVKEDESLTTRMLAENFNVNQSTVVCRLKKVGKVWKIAGWNNRADHVRIFTELLQRNEQTPFLKNLVTGLLFKNVKRKKVYVSLGVSPKGETCLL
ncbi:histone-lysine N-methyltransferase SETMAR [Trichonephila inaurata madagascariensis]|uniref:Histone-lysine N-methyltransferase SETMAR n=1 Tax=Trichonephila inaurata madagascariensis TaxID=2747483 RepID=A0A8X6XI75_9ARAC|nr:histone-lysine N-methyltransferase SETMAR [Trichonephila inaurata madagascariensis]